MPVAERVGRMIVACLVWWCVDCRCLKRDDAVLAAQWKSRPLHYCELLALLQLVPSHPAPSDPCRSPLTPAVYSQIAIRQTHLTIEHRISLPHRRVRILLPWLRRWLKFDGRDSVVLVLGPEGVVGFGAAADYSVLHALPHCCLGYVDGC